MTEILKIAGAAAVALLVGLLVGYLLGRAGRGAYEKRALQAERRLKGLQQQVKVEASACAGKVSRCKGSRNLLRSKEQLLRAVMQLYANNFGLASQHLAAASARLARVVRGAAKRRAARIQKLRLSLAGVQTLTMKLDPMARTAIVQLLQELEQLPGAR